MNYDAPCEDKRQVSEYFCGTEGIAYLEDLHRFFVIVWTDKAASNFAFACKKYNVSHILDEVGLKGTPSSTYNIYNVPKSYVIKMNNKLCKTFALVLIEKQKDLPIMYLLVCKDA